LSTKDIYKNDIATKYLGRALITLIIGMILIILAILGYNSNMSITKKGIEITTNTSIPIHY